MDEDEEEIEDVAEEESESEYTTLWGEDVDSEFLIDEETSEYNLEKRKFFDVPSGIVTEQHLKDIAHDLGLIKLCWTDVPEIDYDEYDVNKLLSLL